MTKYEWFAIVDFGYGACPSAPRGPWRFANEAFAALDRHVDRLDSEGGSYLAATNARVVGPYASRAAARDADIATGSPCRR